MSFPMVKELLGQLLKKPNTNPFPAAQLPPTVTGFLEKVGKGEATIAPPVPTPVKFRGTMTYKRETCIGCNLCIRVCPAHAIELVEGEKKVRFFLGQCISCGQCTEICPKKCLELNTEFLTADADRYSKDLILG